MKNEWNLGLLIPEDNSKLLENKRKEWKRKTYSFISKWKDRTDYLKNPKVLKKALDEYEEWDHFYGTSANEAYYLWLRTHQDQTNPVLKARFNKMIEFTKRLDNDIQFFTLKLAKVPKLIQEKFLKSPELNEYRHFLKRMFDNSKYLLSEPEEKLMTLKSTGSYSLWVKMVSESLSKEEAQLLGDDGKVRKRSFSEISALMMSQSQRIRDGAAEAFNKILLKHVDGAEAEMNAILLDKKINDELRGLKRADEARHISDDIESEVVNALIDSISKRFDISRRYYSLKARLMKKKVMKYHERSVPYGKIDIKYGYPKAKDMISKVFGSLDSEFLKILEEFIENGQIDVYPRKGKSDGAFCVHFLKSQPTYILLNYMDRLRDVITFAHELGHGINNELTRNSQNSLYFDTSTATAEVASTFMEDFVIQELMKEADDELRLDLMMQKLNDDISSIMRQIACYKFERELHSEFRKNAFLSKDDIGKLFRKHMCDYMGKYVEQSEGSENWWVYWSHIRSYFYNYSYASGILISKSMQNAVKKDPKFIAKVKEFLSAGTSRSPKEIFKEMGIDISKKEFWNQGLEEVDSLLMETEKLARKLGKIK